MFYVINNRYNYGFIHFIAYNFTCTGFSKISIHNKILLSSLSSLLFLQL